MRYFSLLLFSIIICLTLPSHSSARLFPNVTVPGEKVDGLAKLKKHLNYLGYFPNLSANLTDHFDDELESALKTYQTNFNLNVTGELDDHTINHLVLPRCGHPDIVHHTTKDLHTVGHYSFFHGIPVWPKKHRSLTFAFLPENKLSNQMTAVFVRAFHKWSTFIPVTFTESTSYDSADIKIGFFFGHHGDGYPFDGGSGVLAHGFAPPVGSLHMNSNQSWFIGDDITTTTNVTFDVETVAVHEIGHVLGLNHSLVKESIMWPFVDNNTKKIDLTIDDIKGIQLLYGDTKAARWIVGVVLAVGAGLLVVVVIILVLFWCRGFKEIAPRHCICCCLSLCV